MSGFVPPPPLNDPVDDQELPELSSSGSTTKAQVHFARMCGILQRQVADINTLQYYCRRGLPDAVRGEFWRILLGCAPLEYDRREAAMEQHLTQYNDFIATCCHDIDDPTKFVDKCRVDVDIGRTLPSLHFFAAQQPEDAASAQEEDGVVPTNWTRNQRALRRVLHLFSRLNPGLGYVQGMNEVVGHLMYSYSSGAPAVTPQIEAEVFFSFQALSRYLGDNFCRAMDFDPANGVLSCLRRYHDLLQLVDPELCDHLDSFELKPEFYAFRWVTLMFTQEFLVPDVLLIWDHLFSNMDDLIVSVIFFGVAMAVAVRDAVLPMDFPQALQFIQSYPREIQVETLIQSATNLEERYKRRYVEKIASPVGDGSGEGTLGKARALLGSWRDKLATAVSRGKENGTPPQ